ncbi:SLAP domain-containing protein [Lactobacillus sp. ESL0680]|uniref:SLAP domain-containing protein n=1 Tax=Lactobacillus sp. ESL0680 TaxID=2983210 RepID=UPI0023F97E01|nr:SLAP domain-containing protein [Lactobacillus sp. ESL0680]WEV38034.1 SLAP domain-containing protein [Lactobacillus sp. ESL0680]
MKKNLLLGLIGTASLSLGLTIAAPVNAATEETPATSQPANTNQQQNTTGTTTADNQPAKDQPASSNSTSNTAALGYINKYVKLKKNSTIYDAKGNKVKKGKTKLKKNMFIYVTGFISTKGKSLLQFDNKKQYIDAKNVKTSPAASYKLKRKAYAYNSKGKNLGGTIAKGKVVLVVKTKKIHKTKFVGITFVESLKTYYIKWSDLNHKSGQAVNQ